MSRPWKVALGRCTPMLRKLRRVEAHDERVRGAAHERREQAVIGGEEVVPAGAHRDDVARGADARIDHRDVHRPGREVTERARQPEAGFCGPVHHDLVRQIDDARLRESA